MELLRRLVLVTWLDILLPHHLLLLKVRLIALLHTLVLRQKLWALRVLHAASLILLDKLLAGSYQMTVHGLNHLALVNDMLGPISSVSFDRSNGWSQLRTPVLYHLCVVMLDFIYWALSWWEYSVVRKRMVVWLHLWLPAPSNSHFLQKYGIDLTLHFDFI